MPLHRCLARASKLLPSLIPAVCILFSPFRVSAGSWKPDPALGDPAQHARLYSIGRRYGDEHFDETKGLIEKDPGRHRNYMLRESAYYAYALLLTGDIEDRKRAERIIPLILSKQDLRKDKPSYGCFPPNYEDQWENLVNVDLNYTQFVGMALAQILDLDNQQKHVLAPELRNQLENSIRLAVASTIRRDVDPGYTNIAFLSAAFACAGEKLLGTPGGADFALSKLYWFLSHAQPGSTMREYLAPTYYGGDLTAAYLVKVYASSPEVAKAADRAINFMWADIAASYHTPTMQLAGPHSRAYGENMLEYAAGLKYPLYLALDGKYPINDTEKDHNWDLGGLVVLAGLPITVRPEFKMPPVPWREVNVSGGNGMALRQYRKGDFILGSINEQSLWQQQRSFVAYWPITTPTWNVAFCMDMSAATFGNGYAHYISTQEKGAVLAAITGKLPVPQRGGLRFGFNAEAQAKEGAAGSWVVRDGEVTTYIYPVTASASATMTSQIDQDHGRVYVERSWATADPAGKFNALGYLVVFQLPGESVPVVKDISFKTNALGATLSAVVNGQPLALQASR